MYLFRKKQKSPRVTIQKERVTLNYNKKNVVARRLRISSELHIDSHTAWDILKKSELLKFVTKGKITFKPITGSFPMEWQENMKIDLKMYFYGWFPIGGTHSIYFEKIDPKCRVIITKEKDR